MYKWFLGLFGFFIYRIPGFFVGFFIGSFLDNSGIRRVNSNVVKEFEINLLSLTSILIKSDGKISSSELQFVRNYFISIYGSEKASLLFKRFNNEVDKSNISAEKICFFYRSRTTYETRLQIINLLFNVAKSDGNVSNYELEKLLEFSNLMKISRVDFESLKAMFIKSTNSDYKILEVDKSCTDSELKKAYRDLAKKHHPDKVQHLGEAYIKSAKEKFSRIQAAYENVKKQRGIA